MPTMSFTQEITAVRDSLAGVSTRAAHDPDLALALGRLDYTLEELQTADDELTTRSVRFEQLAAEAHAARARWQALFATLPVGAVITDTIGTIRALNPAAAAILGPESVVMGKPMPLRVPEHDRGSVRTRITRARMGERAEWNGFVLEEAIPAPVDHLTSPLGLTPGLESVPLPDGETRPAATAACCRQARAGMSVAFTVAPLHGAQGAAGAEPIELLWTLQDRSSDQLLHEKLMSLQLQLAQHGVQAVS